MHYNHFLCPFSDLELYNEALKIIHEFREYFPFGTGMNTWFFISLYLELQAGQQYCGFFPYSMVNSCIYFQQIYWKLLHVLSIAYVGYFLWKCIYSSSRTNMNVSLPVYI